LAGERVLVKNQTNQAENGIYDAAAGAWTRSPDANTWDELISALVFIVEGGQSGAAYYCPIQPGGTLGVTAITWNNFSVGGVYFAGTGLNLSGGDTFNITNTGVTAATYGSASTVPAIAVNLQGQITSATNTSIAIAGSQVTSGTIDSARISGSYTGITAVGTLSGLTVSSTITGSISGNAATATTATSATTATTATNLAGGTTGSVPYQSGAGATTFVGIGSTGQVLTVAGGVPTWATPTTGTVTSVGTAGTVNGLTLTGGPITGSGTVTLGGTLDLSSPPTIGNTTANTIRGTTVTATTGFVGTNFDAAGSGGGALRTSGGSNCLQWGGGGGVNVTVDGPINMNGANSAIQINPTGTGTVSIAPAGALTVNPTTASTMNNVAIGGTTPLAGTFTDLRVNNTISLAGSTGTAGYVLTSNGASAPTWQANANGVTITDDTTTNATRYLTFSELTTGTETTLDVSSTKLQFNPSTGILTSTGLAGALNGTVGATTPNTGAFTTSSLKGLTSGTITLDAAAVAGTNTATFPDATGNVVLDSATQTLTNKSIDSTQLTGTIAKARLPTGSILQVVTATISGEQSTTSSSFVDAGLSLSITPTSATSKIFVLYTGSAGTDDTGECYLTLVRNSTNLGNGTQGFMRLWFSTSNDYHFGGFSMSYLDSPATTSATTYKVQFRNGASFVYISGGNSTDSLTVFEIAA